MSNVRMKYELYVLSLWLLFLLIIIVTIKIPVCFGDDCSAVNARELMLDNVVPLFAFLFLLAGVEYYRKFKFHVSGGSTLSRKVVKIQDMNYEHLTFLTTYIIPLICFNLESVRYTVALVVLLVVIGVIFVKTDKYYTNPTMALLGFKLYQADIETRTTTREQIIIVTLDDLLVGDSVGCFELDDKVNFARKRA